MPRPPMDPHQEESDEACPTRYGGFRLGLFVLVVTTALLVGHHLEGPAGDPFAGLLDETGPQAALLFVALFLVLTLVFVPATPLVVAAGVLFGAFWGTVLAWSAGMASAAIAYAVGRFGGRPLRRVLGDRAEALLARVDLSAVRTIMLLRMVLVFPFSAVNYGLGLAQVAPRRYLVGTMLGNLPWILAFAILGAALGSFRLTGLYEPRFLLAITGASIAVVTLFALGRSWNARRTVDPA